MSQKNQDPESWAHLIDETPQGAADSRMETRIVDQIKEQGQQQMDMSVRLAVLEVFGQVAGIYVSPIAGPDEIKKVTVETLAMFEDYVRHGVASS